jgi:hypothetical protein
MGIYRSGSLTTQILRGDHHADNFYIQRKQSSSNKLKIFPCRSKMEEKILLWTKSFVRMKKAKFAVFNWSERPTYKKKSYKTFNYSRCGLNFLLKLQNLAGSAKKVSSVQKLLHDFSLLHSQLLGQTLALLNCLIFITGF